MYCKASLIKYLYFHYKSVTFMSFLDRFPTFWGIDAAYHASLGLEVDSTFSSSVELVPTL